MNNLAINLNQLSVSQKIEFFSTRAYKNLSQESLGRECGMTERNIARYLRCNRLIPQLKEMLDEETLTLGAGVELSHLSAGEQRIVYEVSTHNCITLSVTTAKALRSANKYVALSQKMVQKILGVDRPLDRSAHKGPVSINLPAAVYQKYFSDTAQKDVQSIMEEALELYFKRKGA